MMNPYKLIALVLLVSAEMYAQNGPGPGDIYREYSVDLHTGNNWRVTDPDATHPGAAEFLPNPVLSLEIDKLENAIKAEVLIDVWGGHPGTSGKKFRFNENEWIDIPRVPTLVISSQCYMKEYNVILEIPLEHLKQGKNYFEGTSGGQVCGNFNWGQWGWYVMMVRIYYEETERNISGSILFPRNGDTIRDNSRIAVNPGDSLSVSQVQVLGNYYGYDENGDGIFKDWHRAYHSKLISGHIGTMEPSIFEITWNTRFVPDQQPGAISFIARIQDTTGLWHVTEKTAGITLYRPDTLSVKMHRPQSIPEKFWVRDGQTKNCYISVPDQSGATEAVLLHRTWNAGDDESAGGTIKKTLRVNYHGYKCYGKPHFFAYSGVPLATGDLVPGDNKISYTSDTEHHGIEILWPGPALMIRYIRGAERVISPGFFPADGYMFQGNMNPVIINQTAGSRIYYTINGGDPNQGDSRYRGQQLFVNKETVIKARAFKTDCFESEVSEVHYYPDVTGINGALFNNYIHFPNPAYGRVFLNIPTGKEDGYYFVYTLEGKRLAEGRVSGNEFSVEGIQPGIYILKYKSPDYETISKIMIQ